MNLLIVEDDVRLASALAHILEEAGHAVDTANDGETGYAYASQGKYDVAILDVMLPKKNGFDVCRALRDQGSSVPVIILTAREEEADKVLGLDVGADDYITKPFNILEV
ncbi:MAG: DNA-binding response regulator, partial [Slackia sp.]|nr:DNA-binding response regulator [Slackia sp.]